MRVSFTACACVLCNIPRGRWVVLLCGRVSRQAAIRHCACLLLVFFSWDWAGLLGACLWFLYCCSCEVRAVTNYWRSVASVRLQRTERPFPASKTVIFAQACWQSMLSAFRTNRLPLYCISPLLLCIPLSVSSSALPDLSAVKRITLELTENSKWCGRERGRKWGRALNALVPSASVLWNVV